MVLRGERDSNIPDLLDRPDQLTQRNGRILRQGNENKEVEIFNYITEGSFDSYLYQILENKQKFISQVMTEKSPLRACDDIDEVVLTYAEIKGLAMKNPFMKEKMQVETEINKINLLKGNWLDNKERYKHKIENLPTRIENLTKSIENIKLDIETYKNNKTEDFEITLNNIKFDDRTKAGQYFMELKTKIEKEKNTNNMQEIGAYAGFKIAFTTGITTEMTTIMTKSKIYLIGNRTYDKELGSSEIGNIKRIENLADEIGSQLQHYENSLNETKKELELLKEEVKKPFEYDERLNYLLKRKIEIDYNIANGITEETNQLNIDDIASIPVESSVKVVEPIEVIDSKEDLGKDLYNQIYSWGYDVFNNKKDYIKLEAVGFDDLVLEKIGRNEYSLAHYSILNGDAMRSPEITFKIVKKSLEPTSYLDDYLGDYKDYEELKENPNLILELKDFFNSWLTNIESQFEETIEKLKKQNNELEKENNQNTKDEINDNILNDKSSNVYEEEKNNLGKMLYTELYKWGDKVLDKEVDYIELNENGKNPIRLEYYEDDTRKYYENDTNSTKYIFTQYLDKGEFLLKTPQVYFTIENETLNIFHYLYENDNDDKNIYYSYNHLKDNPSILSNIQENLKDCFKNITEQIKEVSKIKELYPVGTMIMLESMANENLPKGIIGKVKKVDDIGQLQMVWQNGSSLALNIKTDKFKVLNRQINNSIENKEVEQVVDYEQDMEEI